MVQSALNTGAYGIEFSGDGTKLYGTTSPNGSAPTTTCVLFQWNICAGNASAIIASQYSINIAGIGVGSAQRAVDGKIYIAPLNTQSIHVINNPNANGAAMNFVLNGQSLGPKLSKLGFPNYINTYSRPTPSPFTNTIACNTTSFSVPPVLTFSSGCSVTPYAPSAYLWDFGEPSVGAANSSTLSNPVHTYSTTGTYSVSLILYSNCTNDTLKKVISITTLGPSLSVSGASVICKGAKLTYSASGASTYTWSNNVKTPTVALTPNTTTVYSVTATTNGCSMSKQFTVSVNNCTGISSNTKEMLFSMYPNPVKDWLLVEAAVPATFSIFDITGNLLLQSNLDAGQHEIDTKELKPGIYTVQANGLNGLWRARLVKVD